VRICGSKKIVRGLRALAPLAERSERETMAVTDDEIIDGLHEMFRFYTEDRSVESMKNITAGIIKRLVQSINERIKHERSGTDHIPERRS
jgi:hypothetical protein